MCPCTCMRTLASLSSCMSGARRSSQVTCTHYLDEPHPVACSCLPSPCLKASLDPRPFWPEGSGVQTTSKHACRTIDDRDEFRLYCLWSDRHLSEHFRLFLVFSNLQVIVSIYSIQFVFPPFLRHGRVIVH